MTRKPESSRYAWSRLSSQQKGAYNEYFVKMEFTMYGFQVYTTEVDDRGVDFVVRYGSDPFFTVQVKSSTLGGYVFLRKDNFPLADNQLLALAVMQEGEPPELFVIPATVWKTPNQLFVSRDYEGKKSDPEWGITTSPKNIKALSPFRFDRVAEKLINGETLGR